MDSPPSKHVFHPQGKTFSQRLAAFLHGVQITYGFRIRQDHGRTPQWQQRLHICHMFLYNAYQTTEPQHVDPEGRTISWSHITDPGVRWVLISYVELLRTAADGVPEKDGSKWKKGNEPDRAKSEARMKALLVAEKVGNSGTAMIASGLKPCGEPCGCGAGRSNHLDGLAADLNRHELTQLERKLTAAKAGSLEHLLALYGLHRPLLHHPKSPEFWHVEAIPANHPHHPNRAPSQRHV